MRWILTVNCSLHCLIYQRKTTFVSATDSAYVGSVVMRPSRLGEDDIIVDTVDYNIQGGGLAAPVLLTESKIKG